MKIKKIFLGIIGILFLTGCTNIKNLDYDDIINMLSISNKNINTYNQGFKYYIPKGLSIKEAGSNYSVIEGEKTTYYLYIDLISYFNKKELNYVSNKDSLYSEMIKYQDKLGYVNINLWKNNQYLIEIMYNYAKIEVMVDEELIKEALINSVRILRSIEYNDTIIENLLNDDNLNYTEEVFDMFKDTDDNSNILDYVEDGYDYSEEENQDKDTDYIN